MITSYRSGDETSLELLFARHLRAVYGAAYRIVGNREDAEDVTQETFVKTWRALTTFDVSKSFRPWLMEIARNTAIDALRKKRGMLRSTFALDGAIETIQDPAPIGADVVAGHEMAAALAEATGQLPAATRTTLELRGMGYTFREIGAQLKEPLHTVKSRYRRALLKVRHVLRRDMEY